MAAAVAIYSLAPHGFITGDDASYYRLASHAARYIQGDPLQPSYAPPFWGGDAYLFGGFVYLETALFVIFGPDVRIPLLLNSAMAVVVALLVYTSAVGLFGVRVALIAAGVVALYPSLIVWSSLNLKDSLTTAFATFAVWALVAFAKQPRILFMLTPFVAAEALVILRGYVAATIAIAAALTIAVAPLTWGRRVMSAAVGSVIAVAIVFQSLAAIGVGEGNQLLTTFERVRAAMAVGANTAFVPALTPQPSPAAPATTVAPSAATVAPPGATVPASAATVAPSAATVDVTAAPTVIDAESPPKMTLSYLPVGLAYAIFAPVPLSTRRIQELITAPEMVWWYLLCLGALVTLGRERQNWQALAPVVVTTGGILLVLALTEGNVGTLFRHRGMVVPLVALLAAPALAQLNRRFMTRKAGS
jgi:4-amino-4-deoxy-L-arabinose transferase-like glycosyltransferase